MPRTCVWPKVTAGQNVQEAVITQNDLPETTLGVWECYLYIYFVHERRRMKHTLMWLGGTTIVVEGYVRPSGLCTFVFARCPEASDAAT